MELIPIKDSVIKLMIMRFKSLFVLLFLSLNICCVNQNIDWQRSSSWKIYNVRSRDAFRIPLDSLRYLPSTDLDSVSINTLLRQSEQWPKEKTSVWMGAFLASCELNGERRKILLSTYGGFFYDELSKQYYEIAKDQQTAWYEFINSQLAKFQ